MAIVYPDISCSCLTWILVSSIWSSLSSLCNLSHHREYGIPDIFVCRGYFYSEQLLSTRKSYMPRFLNCKQSDADEFHQNAERCSNSVCWCSSDNRRFIHDSHANVSGMVFSTIFWNKTLFSSSWNSHDSIRVSHVDLRTENVWNTLRK